MALVGRFEYKGLVADMAYVRIEEVNGGKMFGWNGTVKVYADQETAERSLTTPPEEPDPYSPSPNQSSYYNPGEMAIHRFHVHGAYTPGESPLPTLYASLKRLPAFANFSDV